MRTPQHHSNHPPVHVCVFALALLFAGLVVAGCQDRPEPPIAPIDADATGMAGGGGYGRAETAADGPALILHAEEVGGDDPSDPPVFDCDEEHPDTEADSGKLTDILVYVKVPVGASLGGLQVAFEWPASWEYLGWMGTYQPHSIAITPSASGPTTGTLAIAFDCVATGGTAIPVGVFRFRPGPSGCLHLVQSSYPNGNHVADCANVVTAIPADNWGSVCAEDEGYDPLCGSNAAPTALASPTPDNGAAGVATASGLDLAWQGGLDPEGGTVTYRVLMSARGRLTQVAVTTEHTVHLAGPFQTKTKYQWRVVATDSAGAETRGETWKFTTATAPNLPPTALTSPTPADSATGVAVKKTTLRWLGGDDPEQKQVKYDLYLDTANPPVKKIGDAGPNKKRTLGRLDALTTYYWKVVASDKQGATTEGPVWRFTTGTGTGRGRD